MRVGLAVLVVSVACAGEPAGTETVDSEVVDTESADTEVVDTESADTEVVDKESTDTEVVDTESADTWGPDGRLTASRRIDFTDHGTPDIHPYPHQHTMTPNNPAIAPKGGYVSSPAEPMEYP